MIHNLSNHNNKIINVIKGIYSNVHCQFIQNIREQGNFGSEKTVLLSFETKFVSISKSYLSLICHKILKVLQRVPDGLQ